MKRQKRKLSASAESIAAAVDELVPDSEQEEKGEKPERAEQSQANFAPLGQRIDKPNPEKPPSSLETPQYKVGRSSIVWHLFQKCPTEPSVRWCPVCQIRVKHYNGTESLEKHFTKYHRERYNKELDAIATWKKKQGRQTTLDVPVLSETCKKKITRALAVMVCVDKEAFSIVEREGFRFFCRAMQPGYELPSRPVIVKALQEECSKIERKLRADLQKIAFGSLTSDGWTGPNGSYVSLTFHYLDDEWNMREMLLRCAPFRGSHSAVNVANFYRTTLSDYELTTKALALCTDNGANFTAAVRAIELDNPTCAGHNINLTVRPHGIEKVHELKEAVAQFRAMVGHIKHSNLLKESIKDYQTKREVKTPLSVIQDVPTRWNTVYLMLDRALKIREAIESALYPSHEHRPYLPEATSWAFAGDLVKILKPFLDATLVLSGTKYATASVVFPIYRRLLGIVNEQIKRYDEASPVHSLLSKMKVDLKNYIFDCGDQAKMASMLDPRFLSTWRSDSMPKQERDHLMHELRKLLKAEQHLVDEATEKKEEKKEEQKEQKEKPNTASEFELFPESESEVLAPEDDELTRYWREPALGMKANPLSYWHTHLRPKYPVLARIARRFFSIVASSVASERLFSKMGELIDDLRASLDPVIAEQQVFVLHNKVYVTGLTPKKAAV